MIVDVSHSQLRHQKTASAVTLERIASVENLQAKDPGLLHTE
jgi:hypothetical protein